MHVFTDSSISVPVLLCFTIVHLTIATVEVHNDETNSITTEEKPHSHNDVIMKQVWEKRCSRQYNVGCLKLDLVRLVDRLDGSTNLQILPGVSLVKAAPSSTVLPTEVISTKPDVFLDNYLMAKFTNYLSSLTINVKVLDPAVVNTAKSFSERLFGPDSETTSTARRKNRFGNSLATAGLMSGATLLALGMSALAAMAGKALMASLLSLMLSAMAAMKGHGDGHKSTTYEIITKPVVTHAHSHSSEVQHLTGHGGHGSHDSGYGYARSMASTPVQPVVNEEIYKHRPVEYQKGDGSRLAYRGHEPPTLSSYLPASSSSTPTPSYAPQPLKY